MKRSLLFCLILSLSSSGLTQNVFNPSDPIVRYDKTKALGTAQNPNPAKAGLQKWVSVPTTGVSLGTSAWNASSFKAYYINVGGARMAFRVKFPTSYTTNTTKRYPVMLFLHGAGEAGCSTNGGIYNNEKQLWLGGSLFMGRVDNGSFDGFLVYPQLVTTTSDCWGVWGATTAANFNAVFAMIDSLGKYARANIDRVVVDGLSGGGFGAWRSASSYPTRVAKIIPSANAGSTSNRTAFVHIPIWFATGGKDPDPSPAQAQYTLTRMKEIGADIRYTQYPTLGHNMWYNHWREPDFVAAMNDAHKANPLVFFQKTDYCSGEAINSKLGITPGYYAYEWQKDGITIATRTNGVNTIVNGTSVISFTGNEINVRSLGSYRVRFKRSASAAWSDYSPKPAVIRLQASGSQAEAITVVGIKSKVLPALDGSTTVPLTMPAGYINYDWRRVSDNVKVSSAQTYNAPIGVYKAKYDVRTGCGPSYSPNFTVVNANGTPKPDPATNLTITTLSSTSVRLNWSQNLNETNFEVYRSTTKGGPYQLLAITGPNITTYTDATLATNTTYYYVVRSVNNTGAAAKSNEASPNGGNTPPVISTGLSNIYMKTGTTASRTFSVTDNAGDVVTVSILSKPTFATLTKLTTTSYRINVTGSMDNVGWHELRVLAADNRGMSTLKVITVLIANANTKSVFLNLGTKTAPAPWNNWTGTKAAGAILSNLKDEASLATTFDVTAVNAWATTTTLGHITGNNTGVVPDAVLETGISNNGTARQIRFSGLSTTKRYNIAFISSQNEGIIATSSFAANGQTSVVDARYNTQRTANLNSLTPDAAGTILVTITRTGSTAFTYLNGVVIEEYSPTVTLLNPENLYAEPLDRTSVQLTWSDKTNNESATAGYEVQRATNSTFSTGLVTVTLPGNANSYKSTGLASNLRYFFRVRAKNGTSFSGYSNSVSTITPASIIYVNFNSTVPNAAYPWNNLANSPLSTFTSASLRNQAGTTTTVKLKLEKTFNGEFTAGVSTGNNSGIVPDNALKANYWLDKLQVGQFRVLGLNTTRRYRFGFFGSSSSNGWTKGNYTATYTIADRTVYLNSWMNSTKIVYIADVKPNSAGEVLLDFSTTAAAQYGFNGGVLIEDYTDGTGGVVTNSVLEETEETSSAPLAVTTSVYPNPFADQVVIEMNNSSAANRVVAELYDVAGKLTYRYEYKDLPAGNNIIKLNVPASSGNHGVHILALKVNGTLVTTKQLIRKK
jgi:pimeloyl-ACP methyl ester carboxylesterase